MIYAVLIKYKNTIKPLANSIVVDNSRNNRGFARGANIGIKQAISRGATRIILINPDVKISPENIRRLSESNADIVSPVLKFRRHNNRDDSGGAQNDKGKWVYDLGGKVDWMLGRTWHMEMEDPIASLQDDERDIDYVSGACMVIKKEVFAKIGFFDERFFLYFEDVDFCLRAKEAGFSVVVDTRSTVEHDITEHRFSHDRFKIQQNLKSNLVFINKWVPWYFKPVAYTYWLSLAAKIYIFQ